jgi:predicted ATPase/class 3 adenylate cyclase
MLTFLFTDIEGSTSLWQQHPREMAKALAEHDALLERLITEHDGRIVKHTGDGVFAVFDGGTPMDCALAIQTAIQNQDWGALGEIRLRIALHSGVAESRGDDYFGPDVNLTARILAAAWGGQILLSSQTAEKLSLPTRAIRKDMGVHVLESIPQPQHIFQLSYPNLKLQSFPGLRTQSSHPNNLPQETTPFVGRAKELAGVRDALQSPHTRLLTLVGPGGMGKTRLAIKVAQGLLDSFPHGIFFVPLAPLSSADLVLPAIAEEVRFQFYSSHDHLHQLANYFAGKKILLILDNFEHLLEASGLVVELLSLATDLRVLVTSRARLGIQSENIFNLEGMVLDYDARSLFLQNALRIRQDYVPSAQDDTSITEICRTLDGIPLAIELAASWVRYLTCDEIKAEITRDLTFLKTTAADSPDRQKSLEAVFDYSWQLLTDEERTAFSRLALFRGSFSREAAEQVADVPLPMLATLLDKSLIKRRPDGRFQLHEVLRIFALEKLNQNADELAGMKSKHSRFYLALLISKCITTNQAQFFNFDAELVNEIANIDLAWLSAAELGEFELLESALDAFVALNVQYNSINDLKRFLTQSCALLSDSIPTQAMLKDKIDARKHFLEIMLADFATAELGLQKYLEKVRSGNNDKEVQYCLNKMALLAIKQGEFAKAKSLWMQILDHARNVNDVAAITRALTELGIIAIDENDFALARKNLEEGLAIYRKLNDKKSIAGCLNNLSVLAVYEDRYDYAIALLSESLELKRELGEKQPLAVSIHNLAMLYSDMGDYDKAWELLQESLGLRKEAGDRAGIIYSYTSLSRVALMVKRYDEARALAEEALGKAKSLGNPWRIVDATIQLGNCLLCVNEIEMAENYYRDGLALAEQNHFTNDVSVALLGFVHLCMHRRDMEKAFQIADFIYRHYEPNLKLSPIYSANLLANLEKAIEPGTTARIKRENDSQTLETIARLIVKK